MLVKITNLDDALVEELKELTGESTASKAVAKAAMKLPQLKEQLDAYKNANEVLSNQLTRRKEKINQIKKAVKIITEI